MEQQETYVKAPQGMVGEALIEGHLYKIPKDGVLKVAQEGHLDTLLRHGFTRHYKEPEDLSNYIAGLDDKDKLVEFIEEHGGEADNSMPFKKLRRLALKSIED